ncbi:hypothetical protein BRC81_05520 [Halobacteriales archaeon QS_1_68_20]|nr:MAG: hypothetical protein BRC81_05520 [Halobacteriales archaeon QS_1_68_20]
MSVDIAIVGTGTIGQFMGSVLADIDGATVVTGIDPDEGAREKFRSLVGATTYASCADWRASDPEVDGLIVASPHQLHYEHAEHAVELGCDLLVEKPMVVDPREADELLRRAEAAGVDVLVGYQRRFAPSYRELKEAVESELGDLRMVSATVGQGWLELNEGAWRTDRTLANGGMLFDTGAHLLETLFWTTGVTAEKVAAVADRSGTAVDVNASLSVVFRSDGRRVVGNVGICGESTDYHPDETITLWGTDGRITYRTDPRREEAVDWFRLVTGDSSFREFTFDDTDYRDHTLSKLRNFVETIRGNEEPEVSGEFARRLVRFRHAARRAWREETTVEVPGRDPT